MANSDPGRGGLGRRGLEVFLALADLATAALLSIGVFVGLPSRWWVVDSATVLLTALFAAGGVGVLLGRPWGRTFARAAGVVGLAAGVSLVGLLGAAIAFLAGIYGAVGRGGTLVFALVVALVLPYLVGLPLAHLAVFRKDGR